jgi:DNA-binding transcriptional LysR family regulator
MGISLEKLQQLVTVARCGSFSRAAAELNISQPALSRSIAAIEARYGIPLFNRLGHGVELTSSGAQTIDQIRSLLQDFRVLESNLRLIGQGKAGKLSLGMSPLLASQILSTFVSEFFDEESRAQLQVLIRPGRQLLDAIKNDEIELFFFPESHIDPDDDLDTELIGHISATFVVRNGHPLLGRERITIQDLSEFPSASSVEPPFAPDIPSSGRLICDNYHILRESLMATNLVGICSTEFVEAELASGTLHTICVDDFPLIKTPIYMAKLRARVHSPLAVLSIENIRKFLRNADIPGA